MFAYTRRVDWHCTPCNQTEAQRHACPSSAPCLFNVSSQADPLEQHDLSAEHPEIVAAMRATYNKLGEQACTAKLGGCLDYIGVADQAAWVAQTLEMMRLAPLPGAGQPLAGPPPPSPPAPPSGPPGPPISPADLLGVWYLNGREGRENTVTVERSEVAAGRALLDVSFNTEDKSCCWSNGVGTISADGRHLTVNASSSSIAQEGVGADDVPCVRFGVGVVSGNMPTPTIAWACTKPDGSYCGWPDWAKQ